MVESFTNPTRMIFMGDSALSDGFRLIGFEAWPDPTPGTVEEVLQRLIDDRDKAFLVLDQRFIDDDLPLVHRVRYEGGRIVISGVPPLHDPAHFHCDIYRLVSVLYGKSDHDCEEAP